MPKVHILQRIVIILLVSVWIAGCSAVTTSPTATTSPLFTDIPENKDPTKTQILLLESETPSLLTTGPLAIEEHTPTPTVFVPKVAKQLTFVSDRSGRWGIHAMDVTCLNEEEICLGEPELLFEWDDQINAYDWSPDGNKIVYDGSSYRGRLFIADWDGRNAIQITDNCGSASWPRWSPDGTQIAFIYATGESECEYLGFNQIKIYDVATGQITSILTDSYDPSRIYWLPEGELAYVSVNSEIDHTEMIHIVSKDGDQICQLPENAIDFSHILDVAFSPDGSQIAYVGWRTPEHEPTSIDIYVTTICGNGDVMITNETLNNGGQAWAPYGNWIAFHSGKTRYYGIFLIKPDGAGLIEVTNDLSYDILPSWRIMSSH